MRWQRMKRRCKYTPSYVERNITVCEDWVGNFQAFYDWAMANGADPSLELDRTDNNAGYNPENCRWITHKENCRPGGRSGKFVK